VILRSSLPRCLAASLLMVGALPRQAVSAPQSSTLQVRISDREIADLGSPVADINEPDVCVSRDHRIAAAQQIPPPLMLPGRYTVGTNQASGWTSGELTGFQGFDVSIALADNTPNANKFVIAGMSGPSGSIRYCVYSPSSTPQIGPWILAASAGPGATDKVDKPWVIRRTQNDLFLFWYRLGGYRYLRTSDGTDWVSPGIASGPHDVVDASGVVVGGNFCCQPAVGGDGLIWLAHATGEYGPVTGGTIRILVGRDPDMDPPGNGQGPLAFAPLLKANGQAAEIAPRYTQSGPWPATSPLNSMFGRAVPYLACHPTDPTIAYVFYTDTAEDDPDDLNAYVGRFVRTGTESSGYSWSTDTRMIHPEHTSPTGVRCDQFQPVGLVDSAGRIHVAYYSNRPNDFPGCDEGGPEGSRGGYTSKYDYWYSLSVDQGQSFTHYNLRTDCDMKRPLDMDLPFETDGTGASFSPREYNGIDCYESGDFARIHFVYTGAVNDALIEDTIGKRSLLFGQQIQVKPVQNP